MKPLNSEIKIKKLWGFDIETHSDKNRFVMGSIVGDYNVKEIFWDKELFINYIMKNQRLFKSGYLCATNLQFDILSLFKHTPYMKTIEPIIKNSQFLFVRIPCADKRKYLYFLDTWNYYKFSVEKMGSMLGIKKFPKPECFKRRPKNYTEKLELEDYNLRDSFISYKFMKFLQNNFNNMNAQLKLTSPSTSMDLYRRNFQKIDYRQPSEQIIKYLYNAYYGGRTETIKRGLIKNLNYYDANSLYPSVMLNEYPKPTRFDYVRYLRKNAINDYEGVAFVKIESPYSYIPYLPYRLENKLVFPVGIFKGHYTFFELRKALELGYKIHKIYDAVIYFERFTPFKEYVETLYELRKTYKKNNDSRQAIIKLFLNSLYGKFAQKIDYKEIILHESKVTEEMIKKENDFFRSGEWFIFRKKYNRIPRFVNPIFSIYTTAYARDKLFNFMQKVNPKNVFYFDTDSLFTSMNIEDSDKLGEMKLVSRIKEGILIKPKMYLIDDIPKCKGVYDLNKEKFLGIIKDKKIKLSKFVKFKEANRRKLEYNEIIDFYKVLDLEDNKREWSEKFMPDVLQDSQPLMVA